MGRVADVTAERRAAFLSMLSEQFAVKGITLLACDLGREQDRPVWLITVQLPNQAVFAARARLEEGVDPFSYDVSEDIARRIIQHAL